MILSTLAVILVLTPAPSSVQPAQLSLPNSHDDHPWAKFKVGTWVKWKTITVMNMGGSKTAYESETKQTLVTLTGDKAVVEFAQTAMGEAQAPTLVELPFNPEPVDPKLLALAPKPSKTGTETLTVAGKSFACTWTEIISGDKDSGRTVMRTWESDDMPGRIVKTVSTSEMAPGMTSVMTTEVAAYVVK